jgi:hypothetical protein
MRALPQTDARLPGCHCWVLLLLLLHNCQLLLALGTRCIVVLYPLLVLVPEQPLHLQAHRQAGHAAAAHPLFHHETGTQYLSHLLGLTCACGFRLFVSANKTSSLFGERTRSHTTP